MFIIQIIILHIYDNGANVGIRHPYSTYYNSNPEISRNIGIWMYVNPAYPTQLIFESRCVLMMSPFVWSKSENSQCLFGIQNLKLNITLDKLLRLIGGITRQIGLMMLVLFLELVVL